MELYVAWKHGYLAIDAGGRGLRVRGGNAILELGLREIGFQGPLEGLEEVPQDRRGESKVVYLRLAFSLRGLERPGGRVARASMDFSVGPFGVSYTVIEGVGRYLTLHPPPGALYRWVTVGEDLIAIHTIGRRQVYLMEEEGWRRLILV